MPVRGRRLESALPGCDNIKAHCDASVGMVPDRPYRNGTYAARRRGGPSVASGGLCGV